MDQDPHFLQDLDPGVNFRPSGLLPDNLDLSPHHTAFDSFDLRPSSPHFAHTPSYNGSYQNSPYSAASELDFESKDDSFGLSDPLVIPPDEEYDPSTYDAPSSTNYLMLNDGFMSGSNRMSVSVTPADDAHSPYYDHGSPSSSNGGAESGAENDRRSPASSASSHLGVNASPHLDFNQLRVESPYRQPVQIPGEGASPQLKPQSPPVLVIPDLNQPGAYPQDQPVIHAPQGDGLGPRLHIVPATPVGHGNETTQTAGFRNTIPQGSTAPSTLSSSNWAHHSSDPSANSAPSQSVSEFRSGAGTADGSGLSFNFPGTSQSIRTTTTDHPVNSQADEFLLPPSPSRARSKSDTSARPPQWGSALFSQQPPPTHQIEPNSSHFPSSRTVNMNDVLPPVDLIPRPSSSASAIQTSFSSGPLPHPFSYQNSGPSSYLSPESAVLLRRARSDGGGGPRLTHRHSRSEDLGPTAPLPGNPMHNYPPSRHVDFLAQQRGVQFLHPPEAQVSFRGHHRRASSGSRDRGGPTWGAQRASPYPPASPSDSPTRLPEPLPELGLESGQSPLINNMSRGDGYLSGYSSGGSRGATPGGVARPNVTTTATADASMKRRINDAKFQCPVPGCGSTFTRHFNLKGHMRSHNDEKPFQCKWPGCGKGFARQHDCKRHEQLHSNHRPFTCDGCRKPFARLDALNRHLRSEGGSGCAKAQDLNSDQQSAAMSMKVEPDASSRDDWNFNSGSLLM